MSSSASYKDSISLDGRSILVTGGTGSFGQKFVEMVLRRYKPKRLAIYSRDELKQYEMSNDASLIKNTIQKQMRAEEKSLAETTNSASKSGAHAATDSRETDPEWLKHHPSYIAEKARKENDTDKRHQDVEWLRQHPSYFKEMADRNKNAANNE